MQKIYIRNTIGWHITNTQFSAQFQEAIEKDDHIQLHINSPGGSVYMGWDMFNEIRTAVKDGIKIETFNNGLAASMASVLLLAAEPENRYMAENSMFMIHEPQGFAFGDEEKMKKEMALLGKIGDLMAEFYAKVSKSSKEYSRYLMKEETWLTPKESIKEGFIRRGKVVDGGKPIDKIEVTGMRDKFNHVPTNFEKILNFSNNANTLGEGSNTEDLTKMSKSEITERTWKNYMRFLV